MVLGVLAPTHRSFSFSPSYPHVAVPATKHYLPSVHVQPFHASALEFFCLDYLPLALKKSLNIPGWCGSLD